MTDRPDPLVALREALRELDAMSCLPRYLPPKPADEDDQYVLRGAVLALIESTRREIRAALDSIEGGSRPLDKGSVVAAIHNARLGEPSHGHPDGTHVSCDVLADAVIAKVKARLASEEQRDTAT